MVRSWEGGAKAEQAVLVRATAAAAAVRWIAVMVLNILCFVSMMKPLGRQERACVGVKM